MSDNELCYPTSKSIGNEKDTLKYFMVLYIIPRGHVFKAVLESWIVIPQQHNINDINIYHNNFLRRWEMDEIEENGLKWMK